MFKAFKDSKALELTRVFSKKICNLYGDSLTIIRIGNCVKK